MAEQLKPTREQETSFFSWVRGTHRLIYNKRFQNTRINFLDNGLIIHIINSSIRDGFLSNAPYIPNHASPCIGTSLQLA